MLILIGKTASGKTTIRNELVKLGMNIAVTYTNRPMRVGEINGVTYHYISEEEFIQKKNSGFFAETTQYETVHGIWRYGSALEDLTDDKVVILNPDGIKKIRQIKSLNPIATYIMADEETIWDRLRKRRDDSSESRRRLKADNKDFADINKYVDFAFRNDLGLKPELLAEMILYTYKKALNKGERKN